MQGVLLSGLPKPTLSDAQGRYQCVVEPNWSGQVCPTLDGYQFQPILRVYTKVVSSTENQDYQPSRLAFPISGSAGVEGVTMTGLPGNPVTGPDGCYRAVVEHGWSGTVTPAKQGLSFEPPSRQYAHLVGESIHDNYLARPGVGGEQEVHALPPASQAVTATDRSGSTSASAPTVLVVGGTQDADELRQINEDLAVMSLILDQAVEGRDPAEADASGPKSPAGRLSVCVTQAFYLQDYGVAIALWTRPDLPVGMRRDLQMGTEPNTPRDPVWEQARHRLLSDLPSQAPDPKAAAPMDLEPEFKARLITSLQHASNIRHLAPGQWVTLILTGQTTDLQGDAAAPCIGGTGHVAVLRVQKQAVDDYASRLLDPSQFRAKVQVTLQ